MKAISTFARLFSTELYDTGYAEPVMSSGMCDALTESEMIQALAYVHGYADACRLASPFQGFHWRIAQLMGIASGILAACLDAGDSNEKLERLCDTYRRELFALQQRPRIQVASLSTTP